MFGLKRGELRDFDDVNALRTGALCRIQLDEDELCDQCSGELLEQSPSGRAKVQALAANPSSQSPQLAVAAGGEVLIYDLAACCLQASTAVPSRGTVTAMAWHPKGFLALGVDLGALYCLPVAGDQLSELQPAEVLSDATEVTALQFAPQGQWLAVGFRDGRVQIMAVSHSDGTGAKLSHFRQLVGNASAVLGLQFAKAGPGFWVCHVVGGTPKRWILRVVSLYATLKKRPTHLG